ncbi:MAG: hypothetical protein HQK53_03485 [Oligoflexia bacterium]|nr:hypothetical protein [Oligoflexia bacterium]
MIHQRRKISSWGRITIFRYILISCMFFSTAVTATASSPGCNLLPGAPYTPLQSTIQETLLPAPEYTGYQRLRNADPAAISFDKDSPNCRLWLFAQTYFPMLSSPPIPRGGFSSPPFELLPQFLLEGTKYIDYATFSQEMNQCIDVLLADIGDESFVIVVDEEKSSEWLMAKFEDRFAGKNYSVVLESSLSNFLAIHPEVTNIVRMDDGIYSGEQMSKYAKNVKKILLSQGKRGTLHVVAPYSSEHGKRRVLATSAQAATASPHASAASENSSASFAVKFNSRVRIKSINELINEKFPDVEGGGNNRAKALLLRELQSIYPPGHPNLGGIGDYELWPRLLAKFQGDKNKAYMEYLKSIPNQFFQFKVPDGRSGIEPFLRYNQVRTPPGSPSRSEEPEKIISITGTKSRQEINFRCIPYVVPPYKSNAKKRKESEAEFDFIYERDCVNGSSNPQCIIYEEDATDVLLRLRGGHEFIEKQLSGSLRILSQQREVSEQTNMKRRNIERKLKELQSLSENGDIFTLDTVFPAIAGNIRIRQQQEQAEQQVQLEQQRP